MPFIETGFPGLWIFEPKVWEDDRGYFFESFNQNVFAAEGQVTHWVQDNQAKSSFGVIRGLHFQAPPHAQTKLIRALTGSILDVVVDIRAGSPVYGKAYAIELSESNKRQLLVPKGFAHGYSVLSETVVVLYKCDEFYHKETEGGVRYDDPSLVDLDGRAIDWRVPLSKAVLSAKDVALPLLRALDSPFTFSPPGR